MVKLNLGCGTDIKQNFINIDKYKLSGVDIVHDIEEKLPFKDNFVSEIYCKDVLEHIDYPKVLKECHRILKYGGKIIIEVPHFTSRNNFIDPTHKHMFSIRTFEFFTLDCPYDNHYYDFAFWYDSDKRIIFEKGVLFWDYMIEPLVNLNRWTQIFYEATFLSRIFPAERIKVTLYK